MPSIWPFLSAWTAWSLVSNAAACSELPICSLDRVVARRPDLGAQLGVGQVGDRGGAVDGAAGVGDDGLAHVVVAAGEVDRVAALLGDGDLVDVEVELLLPRADHRVERHDDPLDLVGGVPELLGDRVGDGRLVALTVGGVVVDEPGLVRRGVGADGQHAVAQRLERLLVARGGLGGLLRRGAVGGLVRLVARGAAGGQEDGGGQRGGDEGPGEGAHGEIVSPPPPAAAPWPPCDHSGGGCRGRLSAPGDPRPPGPP